jgi:hypothetical protein
MVGLPCTYCGLLVETLNQFFVHEEHGVLCPACFRSLTKEEQQEEEQIREYIIMKDVGWVKMRYRYIDLKNPKPFMLPAVYGPIAVEVLKEMSKKEVV